MAIKFSDPVPSFRVGDKIVDSVLGELTITAVSGRYKQGRTAAAMKPWEAAGISRRTWYRRKKEQKK